MDLARRTLPHGGGSWGRFAYMWFRKEQKRALCSFLRTDPTLPPDISTLHDVSELRIVEKSFTDGLLRRGGPLKEGMTPQGRSPPNSCKTSESVRAGARVARCEGRVRRRSAAVALVSARLRGTPRRGRGRESYRLALLG